MSALTLPPGCGVRVTALGMQAAVLLDPEGEGALCKGRIGAQLSFDPGCWRLDPLGRALAADLLAHGEVVSLIFFGGLADAFQFQSRLRVAEAAQ